jgi:translation initiation factor IF-2
LIGYKKCFNIACILCCNIIITQVMKEMRVKGALVEHKEVRAAMGVKIVAPGLESAVAGTSLYVIGPEDDEEELKDSVMEDMAVSGITTRPGITTGGG